MRQGLQSLGDFSITSAGSYVGDWVDGFECMVGMTVQFRFAYGSGGTSAKVYLQTTLDDDEDIPIDIACVVFGTASEVALLNFTNAAVTTQVNPADGALADDTVVNGIFGDRLRVKIVTSGTYAGSTVASIRCNAR